MGRAGRLLLCLLHIFRLAIITIITFPPPQQLSPGIRATTRHYGHSTLEDGNNYNNMCSWSVYFNNILVIVFLLVRVQS